MRASTDAVGSVAMPLVGWGQVLLSLLLVLAAMLTVLWLLRRVHGGIGARSGGIRVHAAVAVGAKERVVVVEAGGRTLLLGVAAGSVRTLAELDALPAGAAPEAASFGDLLARLRGRSQNP